MKKLMVMVAALAMVTGSAYAAEWNFYGSARVGTFYIESETINDAATETTNLREYLHTNARIGANVKVSDELTGRFEYGTSGGNANVRLLYGQWNFGGGSLLVGQDYSPLNYLYSTQAALGGSATGNDGDANMLKHGGVYSGREAQLKVTFGGFQAALVPAKVATTTAAVSTETKLPGIELGYSLNVDNFALKFGGGYQTYDAVLASGKEDSVTSYVLSAFAKGTFGAFYVAGNLFGGQNAGNMLSIDTDGDNSFTSDNGIANLTTTTVVDSDVFGGVILAGFVLNDMFTIEAGYGYVKTELDTAGSVEDELSTYYLNTTITMAPGVFITPEIGVMDGEETGDTMITYYGIKWQINF